VPKTSFLAPETESTKEHFVIFLGFQEKYCFKQCTSKEPNTNAEEAIQEAWALIYKRHLGN